MDANMKRKLARVAAILAVALGAGQLMQSMNGPAAKPQVAHSDMALKAKDIVTVAAGAEPSQTLAPSSAPALETPRLPKASPQPAAVADVAPTIPAVPVAQLDPCATTFELSNAANAMIGLTVISPCRQNERVVVKHAGLAITGKTTASGALFLDIPALTADAAVEVVFKDSTKLSGHIAVPEVADLRRFAVQFQPTDAFDMHAFEDSVDFGGPGDVSAANTHNPAQGLPAKGGFLTLLGDASTDQALLAQLYTYPQSANAKATVVLEAPVTAQSCGREILADLITSIGGQVEMHDLSAAMPGCDAIGDYLVLNNLFQDMNIAAN